MPLLPDSVEKYAKYHPLLGVLLVVVFLVVLLLHITNGIIILKILLFIIVMLVALAFSLYKFQSMCEKRRRAEQEQEYLESASAFGSRATMSPVPTLIFIESNTRDMQDTSPPSYEAVMLSEPPPLYSSLYKAESLVLDPPD